LEFRRVLFRSFLADFLRPSHRVIGNIGISVATRSSWVAKEDSALGGLIQRFDANESDADISCRWIRIVGRYLNASAFSTIEVDLRRTLFPRDSGGRVLGVGCDRRCEHRHRRGGGGDNQTWGFHVGSPHYFVVSLNNV